MFDMKRIQHVMFLLAWLAVPFLSVLQAQSVEQAREDFIKRQIQAYLVRALAVPQADLLIEYPDASQFRSAAKLEFDTVTILPALGGVRLGLQLLKCRFSHHGKAVRSISFRVRVKRFQTVVVSAAQLDRHTVLQPQHLRLSRRETTKLRLNTFAAVQPLLGLRVSRIVRAGEVITENLVETVPVIMRGNRVEIVVQKGTLQIKMPGIAREDGRLGDIIKVKSPETRKILRGKVINPATVVVNL